MIASYSTSRRTAVLDPGHGGTGRAGGSDPVGAVGPNGLREKDLNLEVAQRVRDLLDPDIHVVMTRTADANLSLANRAKVARDNNADCFVSIHFNACSTPSVDGTVVFVAPGANAVSYSLAQALVDSVSAVTGVRNRGVQEHNYGVIQTNRHLQGTAACLLEVAFLSNPAQARRLEAQAYRQQLAEAIASVLRQQAGLPVVAGQAMAAAHELVGCGAGAEIAAWRGLSASQMAAGIGGMGAEAFALTHPGFGGQTLSTEIPLDPGSGGQSISADALEIGDIIVSTTDSVISSAIRRITDSQVSHAMIYIGDGQVVEAVSEGVVLRSLSQALDEATVAVAFRHPTLTIDQALVVRDYAGQQVGKSYDYWGIVRQAGFQLDRAVWCRRKTGQEYERCVNWVGRINLGKGDDDSFFCSELVLAAYAHAGLPLTERPPHWASPGDIADLRLTNRLGYVGHLKVELPASQSLSGLPRAYEEASPAGVEVAEPPELTYEPVTGQEFGAHWGSRRPPGLPTNARQASQHGQARPHVVRLAEQENLGQVFVDTVAHLAETESGATFALPAHTFDVRPPGARPTGKSYISAWGVFQFNRDAWRREPGISNTAFPWDATASEELTVPIRRYARVFREVRAANGSPIDAARGVRLWHRAPTHYRRYVEAGGRSGFSAAWTNVPRQHASVVDQHLRRAGVLTEAGSQSLAAHMLQQGAGGLQPSEVVYQIEAGQEYGPRWRSQRPPGLPADARQTSRYRQARPYIEQLAGQENLGQAFLDTVTHLAETESGAMFARPANSFDVRPPGQRPEGKAYVSAWGVFQFNRDAWRREPQIPNTAFPWDASAFEELAVPVRRYARLFREVRDAGGSPTDAARGIRLWHRAPAYYRRYVEAGGQAGFSTAWASVPRQHASVVDRHLRSAGVLSEAGSQSVAAQGSWTVAAQQGPVGNFMPLHGPGTGDVFHPTNACGTVSLAVVSQEVATEARSELARWRTSAGAVIREGDAAGKAILRTDYWPAVGIANPLASLGANWWSTRAWSSAFVSYTVNAAAERLGLNDLLANAAAHMRYTWRAYRDRDAGRTERYWAYPPDRMVVEVGDIIVKARGTGAAATWNDVTASTYQFKGTHGDIVVAVSDTAATVIGGNVGNSVRERTYPLSNGFIDRSSATNSANRVFAILKPVGSAT